MINLEKEIREQPAVLAGVRAANIEKIESLVREAKAKGVANICFAARGTSDHASIFAQYLFGIYCAMPCSLATPSVVSQYGGKLHFKDTLVIGVSQSGRAADVIEVIECAKACGAITASVTNDPASPLASAVDYSLCCNAGPEISIAATKTFTSQMYLLATLCQVWSGSETLKTILDGVPAAVDKLLTYMPDEIETFIGKYAGLTDAVVLGRGTSYPIALEGALKVLETNQVRMKGYPISDFHHGPLAQVKEGSLVIVLAPKGPVYDDALEMIDELDRIGADVLIITDDKELPAKRSGKVLVIPALGDDIGAPWCMAVTMQLIALKLTEVKGIDPDRSAVLNKITITK